MFAAMGNDAQALRTDGLPAGAPVLEACPASGNYAPPEPARPASHGQAGRDIGYGLHNGSVIEEDTAQVLWQAFRQ